jgi:uracil-DNA glycosylase
MHPLDSLVAEVRACRRCAPEFPHAPRPVIRLTRTARLCVAGQAPGLKVHETGLPFNDASGDRLRAWMGVTREEFYDERGVATVPMGFCFPGYDAQRCDKPPPRACAATWHGRLFAAAPKFSLILAIGAYAQAWHLGADAKSSLTETVRAWREYGPNIIPLPHPSGRNNGWLKKNPWFEQELLPTLKTEVRRALSCAS